MSKPVLLELADGSGGLNTRDPISAIRKNQFSRLENYLTDEGAYLHKRGGQELIQYAPIDPSPFTVTADTIDLWHLNETGALPVFVDAGPGANNLQDGPGTETPSTDGNSLFNGGRNMFSCLGDYQRGGLIYKPFLGSPVLQDAAACTMEIWVYINPTFSGRPIAISDVLLPQRTGVISNTNAPLLALTISGPNGPTQPFSDSNSQIYNGFTIHRNWDFTANKDAGDPYIRFKVSTNGIAGTVTYLVSNALPTSRWLHVRGCYDSATKLMRLFINGKLHSQASVVGGGTITNPAAGFMESNNIILCGSQALFIDSTTGAYTGAIADNYFSCLDGIVDEARISNVDLGNANFPFKKPRGNPMVLEKADGTKQEVIAADSGLYATVGDGNYTLLKFNSGDTETIDPATGAAISPVAQWDGVMIEDRLYMTNGVNTPLTWDGLRVVPTGEGVTAPTLTLAATGSGNSNGIHKYVLAYKYGNDITGFSPVAQITVSGNLDVNISNIPTRHDNCDSILVYKTKAGGTRYFLDREVANDPTVTSIDLTGPYTSGGAPDADSGADGVADGSTDTDLNDDADYAEVEARVQSAAIKKNKYYLPEHNRLFGCGSDDFPYDLSWSALGNPDVFRATAFVPVSGDKGPLIGMATSHGEILLSKNANATSVLRGTDESNWTLTENIHPKVGARDHWSFVHRYPVAGNGPYMLCFAATDGIYGHQGGNDIAKLSDDINPTFEALATNTSSKEDWITTEQSDFQQAASNGGASTQNVQESRYEQDGLREFAGDVRIVDQLDYLGLWPGNGVLVPGKVTAITPVKVANVIVDGSFLFATDANRNLYLTTDNFVTATIATALDAIVGTPVLVTADHRIMELKYAYSSSTDMYWIGTSDTNDQGYVALWAKVANVWQNSATAMAGPYFWQADIPWLFKNQNKIFGVGVGLLSDVASSVPDNFFQANGVQTKDAAFLGKFATYGTGADNIFVNHAQKVNLSWPGSASYTILTNFGSNYTGQATVAGRGSGNTYAQGRNNIAANSSLAVRTDADYYQDSTPGIPSTGLKKWVNFTSGDITLEGTHRETASWQGGNFRPQFTWDSTVGKMYFVGAGAEDANQNRNSALYSVTPAAAVATVFTPAGSKAFMAICSDGTNLWVTYQYEQTAGGAGFLGYLQKIVMATGTNTLIGQLGGMFVPLRLDWNFSTSRLVAIGKKYSGYNLHDHQGFIGWVNTASGAITALKTMTANGLTGAFPAEIVYQTNTPFSHYIAMKNQQTGEATSIYKLEAAAAAVTDVSTYKLDAYQGVNATNPVSGILSNLIFTPSSGLAGNFLWSDRLYFYAPSTTDSRMIQLGVPGTWTVKGGLTSKTNELGLFSAFGNLTVDYNGNVEFYMRNAATPGALAASERQVTPNNAIQGFSPIGIWAQWRIALNWIYSVAAPTTSPIVSVIDVGFFLGVSTVPRVVTEHWNGRTYFSMAEAGEEENNILIVYDKKNAFTIYKGWRIKGMRKFRNFFTAIQDYELVKLESGNTDLGNVINGLAHTGALADGSIVALDDAEINLRATVNQQFPGKSGFLKLTAFAGGDEGEFPRMVEIPESPLADVQRVHAEPLADFGWDWAQVWSLEIKTSDETSGDFVASPGQQEIIQKIDLKLLQRAVSREYTGK